MFVHKIVVILALLAVCVSVASAEDAQTKMVQVKEAPVRQSPNFLGRILKTLSYGETVNVLEQQENWLRVAFGNPAVEGWMHNSSLSKKVVTLKTTSGEISVAPSGNVSADDVVLAGKGFRNMEDEFKAGHAAANFAAVDRMEQVVISQGQMQKFLKDGALQPEGGIQP
ncbi:SH3 type 3 domain protein [Candidatus Moduliflexus flocculans]|uniref:SH3 type 3 domain protein n=1 Tax=Candidatus Moduliflexus flocculans TaxID=1499966 RepID=A0A081BMG0_9BACT|nr:SH3 type 3 domain protein [Candidatus Moduliflexus flocculans]